MPVLWFRVRGVQATEPGGHERVFWFAGQVFGEERQSMRCIVDCEAEFSGEQRPRRLRLGRRWVPIASILDQWPGSERSYVKVLDAAGNVYILRHESIVGQWEVVVFHNGKTQAQPPAITVHHAPARPC
ncbi:MAG: hypothetical protein DRQ37_05845 [Gammaproteobacteria bacterium]|nr:MAG: hypothetical protein DRQ37_05845 [Gammaproteobacteria bacterium]